MQVVVEVVGGGLGCSRLSDVSAGSGGGLQGTPVGCFQGCLLTLCLLQGLLKVLCGVGARATHASLEENGRWIDPYSVSGEVQDKLRRYAVGALGTGSSEWRFRYIY